MPNPINPVTVTTTTSSFGSVGSQLACFHGSAGSSVNMSIPFAASTTYQYATITFSPLNLTVNTTISNNSTLPQDAGVRIRFETTIACSSTSGSLGASSMLVNQHIWPGFSVHLNTSSASGGGSTYNYSTAISKTVRVYLGNIFLPHMLNYLFANGGNGNINIKVFDFMTPYLKNGGNPYQIGVAANNTWYGTVTVTLSG